MNRAGQPTPPSSAATSRRPDTTTIILRLRLPGPSRPPPQGASGSSGATSLLESSGGVVDAEGVLPPAPATTAGATVDPLESASGVVDAEGVLPPAPATMAGTTADPLEPASGVVDAEGVLPPAPATTAGAAEDTLGHQWGEFFPDLVRLVACRLRSSRKDIERMRAVCPAWREAVPSTVDPLLVLSKRNPQVDSEVILMKIKKSPEFELMVPLSPPPAGVSCWGSALGLMALQCHSADSREILVYCLQCGESKDLLPLPVGMTPRALFLEPLTPQRFLLMARVQNAEGSLYVDSDGFPWPMEGGPWWLQAPGFGTIPLSTMALDPGVVRAGADRDSIVIIDESGRPIDDATQILQIQLPPIILSDGSHARPWWVNGQHLFLCSGNMYLLQVFDCAEAPQKVAVRLLAVEKVNGEYKVTPKLDIGKYSVFVGPNQSFVLPSRDNSVGRLANTIYVEDYRGVFRRPQALAINIHSLSTIVIPFPAEVVCKIEDALPAVWVGLPQQQALFNHCRDGKCWRFWDWKQG